MLNPKKNTIIVGGGLSGLTLAYHLRKNNIEATILEGSDRLGGRIQTVKGDLQTPLELGATWFTDAHSNMHELLLELNLKKYPQATDGISLFQTSFNYPPQQFVAPDNDPSYRIRGGTQEIIHALGKTLHPKQIYLNTKVSEIHDDNKQVIVKTTDNETFSADLVVLCLPPQLVGSAIQFFPSLPKAILQLLPNVQTWMAGSIKFGIEYAEPFWKKKGLSGMLFSHVDMISEIYDHTNFEGNKFGFTGFLNGNLAPLNSTERRLKALKQLSSFFGEEALTPHKYIDKIWEDDFVLGNNALVPQPHLNNGHTLLHQSYFNGKLFFSGTETAKEFSGYMEGAISTAKRVARQILEI